MAPEDEIRPRTRAQMEASFDRWRTSFQTDLSKSMQESYIASDTEAFKFIGLTPDIFTINQSALKFSQEYGNQLVNDGSTTIDGKRVPWMKSFDKNQRKEVAQIIADGIAEGKSTGIKEHRTTGTYPKKSIARDLQQFFGLKASHASTVARTEVARIQNTAHGRRWKDLGFGFVEILDNEGPDSCPECKAANGKIWTIDFFLLHTLEHPNCVRAASPAKGAKG